MGVQRRCSLVHNSFILFFGKYKPKNNAPEGGTTPPGTKQNPAETGLYYLQSRYYNPQFGRFTNRDAFVSTGQGFVGNNMFAYCGNNPVAFEDASGGMRKPCTVMINDGTPSGVIDLLYINDQNDESVAKEMMGIVTVSHGGCGAVATYNALVTLGDYMSFDSVLDYYNNHLSDLTLLGVGGMLPDAVVGFLEMQVIMLLLQMI